MTISPFPHVVSASASWRCLVGAAFPLYLSMATSLLGTTIVIAALGRHATASLAAFTLTAAISAPVNAAVGGALRGITPFVAPHRNDPAALAPILRDARWITLILGIVGAGAVAATPAIARLAGVGESVRDHLIPLAPLMATAILVTALGGGANTVLVALGRSRQVLWSTLPSVAVTVSLTPALVLGLGPLPELGVAGAGITSVLTAGVVVAVAVWRLHRAGGLREPGGSDGSARPDGSGGFTPMALWPGRPRIAKIVEMAGVGGPMSATLLIKFGVLAVIAMAAARISAESAAAHGVLYSLSGLMMIATSAVGQILIGDTALDVRVAPATEGRRPGPSGPATLVP